MFYSDEKHVLANCSPRAHCLTDINDLYIGLGAQVLIRVVLEQVLEDWAKCTLLPGDHVP